MKSAAGALFLNIFPTKKKFLCIHLPKSQYQTVWLRYVVMNSKIYLQSTLPEKTDRGRVRSNRNCLNILRTEKLC